MARRFFSGLTDSLKVRPKFYVEQYILEINIIWFLMLLIGIKLPHPFFIKYKEKTFYKVMNVIYYFIIFFAYFFYFRNLYLDPLLTSRIGLSQGVFNIMYLLYRFFNPFFMLFTHFVFIKYQQVFLDCLYTYQTQMKHSAFRTCYIIFCLCCLQPTISMQFHQLKGCSRDQLFTLRCVSSYFPYGVILRNGSTSPMLAYALIAYSIYQQLTVLNDCLYQAYLLNEKHVQEFIFKYQKMRVWISYINDIFSVITILWFLQFFNGLILLSLTFYTGHVNMDLAGFNFAIINTSICLVLITETASWSQSEMLRTKNVLQNTFALLYVKLSESSQRQLVLLLDKMGNEEETEVLLIGKMFSFGRTQMVAFMGGSVSYLIMLLQIPFNKEEMKMSIETLAAE